MTSTSGTPAGGRRRATRTGYAAMPARVLLGALGLVLVAALVGIGLMWPSRSDLHLLEGRAQFTAPGTTYVHGTVDSVTGGRATVTVEGSGDQAKPTIRLPAPVAAAGLPVGQKVVLTRTRAGTGRAVYGYFATDSSGGQWILVALFVLVLVAVARWKGLLAVVGLAIAGAVLWWFVLPALLVGHHPVLASLSAATVILVVVLYSTHGVRPTTSAALAGTLAGVGVTALLGELSVHITHLTGVTGDAGGALSGFDSGIRFPGLLVAAVVVAGLGILNDVTITQASAVYELRAASPGMSRTEIFRAAMRIGRDHIASTVYTIVFAYAGAALLTLLVIQLYEQPLSLLLDTEDLSEEVVRTLVSSLGLILAVPITTAIASLVADGSGSGHQGHHH